MLSHLEFHMTTQPLRIGIIGYGEVGRIFAAGLKGSAGWTGAWDLKFEAPALAAAALDHAARAGVTACGSARVRIIPRSVPLWASVKHMEPAQRPAYIGGK